MSNDVECPYCGEEQEHSHKERNDLFITNNKLTKENRDLRSILLHIINRAKSSENISYHMYGLIREAEDLLSMTHSKDKD